MRNSHAGCRTLSNALFVVAGCVPYCVGACDVGLLNCAAGQDVNVESTGSAEDPLSAAPPTVQTIYDTISENLAAMNSVHIRTALSATVVTKIEDNDYINVQGFYSDLDEYAISVADGRRFRLQRTWMPASRLELRDYEASTWRECVTTFDGAVVWKLVTECSPPAAPVPLAAVRELPSQTELDGYVEPQNIYLENVGGYFYDGPYSTYAALTEERGDPPTPYAFSLPGALINRDYTVDSEPESINGTECVVLEADRQDRIWLDPSRGYAVVQREWRRGEGEAVVFRILNRDFRKAGELWWPETSTRDVMVPDAVEGHELVHFTVTARLTDVIADNVPDALYSIEFPPGVRIADTTFGLEKMVLTYDSGATPEQTALALEEAVRKGEAGGAAGAWNWGKPAFYIANLVVICVAAFWYFRMRR